MSEQDSNPCLPAYYIRRRGFESCLGQDVFFFHFRDVRRKPDFEVISVHRSVIITQAEREIQPHY